MNDVSSAKSSIGAFVSGAVIAVLGGLIGLGGAEYRLPLLIGPFGFAALRAVILNKALSLIVVATALPFRATTVPFAAIAANWPIIVNLLAGSLIGAWLGASWATKVSSKNLYRIIAVLLVLIAAVLLLGHDTEKASAIVTGVPQKIAGIIAGFAIGIVASLLGVAGGELLIPTLILLFGIEIKLAGSLALVVSLPTMLVGFARYAQDNSFNVIRNNAAFVAIMAAGSIVGTFIGGQLLGVVPSAYLIPILVIILLVAAFKIWRHD